MNRSATRQRPEAGTLQSRLRRALLFALGLGLLGELGHQLLGRWGQALAHHFFHILFGAAAILAFGIYAAVDIRRHGLPRFSRRLRP